MQKTGICLKCGTLCEEVENQIGILRCVKCGFQFEFVNMDKHIRHKSFRKQFKECASLNMQNTEYCSVCGQTLILCVKFGGQCASHKCKEERTNHES